MDGTESPISRNFYVALALRVELSQLSKVRAKSKRNKNTTFDVLRVAGDKFAPENGKMFLVKLC